MRGILLSVHDAVWGIPMLLLILGAGFWIMIRSGVPQITLFPEAIAAFIRMLNRPNSDSGVSPFRAFCTALGATVGTGNIIGIAGAICLGGPSAIFWMWICGFIAMGTKFAEAALAVRYRKTADTEVMSGPMYMITEGMGSQWRPLALCYCLFGLVASFGVGNAAQINAVVSGIRCVMVQLNIDTGIRQDLALGLIFAVAVGSVLLGGSRRIGAAAESLVPAVSVFYIFLCGLVLIARHDRILDAFLSVFRGAFSPGAVTGGMVGSVLQALRIGCSRGTFTNEAGMGTASIAHGSAEVSHPLEQGLMGMVEVFLDTIVLCTLTALVILVSGVPIPYGRDGGGTLTMEAFSAVCGNWAAIALTAAMCCFAFATVLGWGLYGARCTQFLFGDKSWPLFAGAQTLAVLAGALLKTETIWLMSEVFNGLMAIPNLFVVVVLTPELGRLTKEYKKKSGGHAAEGGNYADFHQCQPL